MWFTSSFAFILLIQHSGCMDQLNILYEWNQLDFDFPTPEARQQALDSKTFIPENNIPMGIEIYGDKLFITVTRWKQGVPSSLNYIDLKDNSTRSPKLKPYPNWEAHNLNIPEGQTPEIIAPFRVRADRCGRLWILDSGKIASLDKHNSTRYPPALTIYDLETDKIIRKYVFPKDHYKEESGFAVIAIEDLNCENTFAYAGDVGKAGIVVYSFAKNESWRINHHYFHPDPMACDYNVNGYKFSWTDAIFGLSISAPNANNFSTLYFHPMSSNNEFAISTEYLRNQTVAANNFEAFKLLGSRGPNAQSAPSFLDQKTNVLFYSLVNLNAVACWRTTNTKYDMKNQGRIYMNNDTMIYPSDIKVDYRDKLWILSNKLPVWMYGSLNPHEVNFRVFSAPVLEAISHTACDVTPRSDILDKFIHKVWNITDRNLKKDPNGSVVTVTPSSLLHLVLACSLVLWISSK